ncbi:MAG: hypothetical protein WA915_11485 [Candidatus Aminicenantaceae bacterium]
MPDKKQLVLIPLFWGSLWGLAEATVGNLLHWTLIPGIAGFVMFPIGLVFMVMAFNHSGKLSTIFLTALVAANIKMVDLFFPAHNLFAVINPAIAILCESVALMLVFSMKGFKQTLSRFGFIWSMAFVWRLVYGIGTLSLGFIFPAHSFFQQANVHIVRFFLIDSFANAILIYVFYHAMRLPVSGLSQHTRRHSAIYTIGVLITAVVVELLV